MANELVHSSVGVGMLQAEFEAIGLHVCNSQVIGDLIYANSTTQLSRLGIGSTNTILTVIGGVPTWQSTLAGLTLTAPVINGVVTTTGLTLPAFTASGNITMGANTITITNATLAVILQSGIADGNPGIYLKTGTTNEFYWDWYFYYVDKLMYWDYIGVNKMSLTTAGILNIVGAYQVDGVQVVSNRVIDARCDDALNSGDATTDGVIDSLRDAMITHGLIAAA